MLVRAVDATEVAGEGRYDALDPTDGRNFGDIDPEAEGFTRGDSDGDGRNECG